MRARRSDCGFDRDTISETRYSFEWSARARALAKVPAPMIAISYF